MIARRARLCRSDRPRLVPVPPCAARDRGGQFWRPGASSFRALHPSEPFFFKLTAPHNAIGGFGLFARFQTLPVWQAWDVFGQANGIADAHELPIRLDRLSASTGVRRQLTNPIGCIAVTEPVFFPPDEWVPAPTDCGRSIVSGKRYELATGEGRRIWVECLEHAAATTNGWAAQALGDHRAQVDRCSSPPTWDSRASVSPCSTPMTDSARSRPSTRSP